MNFRYANTEEPISKTPANKRSVGRFKRISSFAAVNLVIACMPLCEIRSVISVGSKI